MQNKKIYDQFFFHLFDLFIDTVYLLSNRHSYIFYQIHMLTLTFLRVIIFKPVVMLNQPMNQQSNTCYHNQSVYFQVYQCFF